MIFLWNNHLSPDKRCVVLCPSRKTSAVLVFRRFSPVGQPTNRPSNNRFYCARPPPPPLFLPPPPHNSSPPHRPAAPPLTASPLCVYPPATTPPIFGENPLCVTPGNGGETLWLEARPRALHARQGWQAHPARWHAHGSLPAPARPLGGEGFRRRPQQGNPRENRKGLPHGKPPFLGAAPRGPSSARPEHRRRTARRADGASRHPREVP